MQAIEKKDSYVNFLFGKQGLAVWTLCLGVGLHAVNWHMVSTIAPTLVNELGNVKLINWITLIYLATSVVFGAYAGYIKRQMGARTAMFLFVIIFATGSFLVSVAPNMQTVLLGRALQGIGEGLILSLSYGVAQDLFSSKATPKLFGLFAFVYAFSAAVGPVFSGTLTELFSWRIAFSANVVFALLYIIMVLHSIPNKQFSHDTTETKAPFLRLTLIGVAIILIGLTSSMRSVLIACLLIICAFILFFLCFKIDQKQENKLFPSQIFGLTSTVGIGFWLIFLLPLPMASVHIFIPLYTQVFYGISITMAGYISTLITFSWSFSAILTGPVTAERIKSFFIFLGTLGQFLGFTLFFTGYYFDWLWAIIMGLFIIGSALGACWAFITQKIVNSANQEEQDLAAAQVPVIQTIANAVGAGFVGTLASFNGLSEELSSPIMLKSALLPAFSASVGVSLIAAIFGLWFLWRKNTLPTAR
ncbi:MFS transporter [Thiothrix eikelboomii]|uniref:MFS transporter n=1 Tax=Thiothrix eikelboomii TaxID=92487 RepID=UPI003BAF1006